MGKKQQARSAFSAAVLRVLRQLLVQLVILGIAVPPGYVASTAFLAGEAFAAGSYADGYSKYQKGDFKGAERSLVDSLKTKMSKVDQAKTLKLLGICQYMQNAKDKAQSTFKKALARDANMKIAASEVLDDSVIPFFENLKPKGAPAAKAAATPKKTAAQAPKKGAAKSKTLAAAKAGSPDASGTSSKPSKKTFLKVLSNVPSANVAIDGIIAGSVNSLINTDPGKVLIEVQAQGYPTKKVYVNVTKDHENSVTVNLEKPKPKPKPKPVPKPEPPPQQQQQQQQQQPKLVKKKNGGNQLAGGKPIKKKKKKKNGTYAPTPGDDMFDGQDGGQGQQQQMGQGQGQQQGGPNLAQQFEMDAAGGGGGYGGQPQGYGQPPPGYGYQQPPPQYYAPPPAYGYGYQQPMYYQPPPPPPPPPDYGAQGGYADPGAPPDPAGPAQGAPADGSAAAPADGKGGNNFLISILPFGAGQFQNKSYMLGLAFLGAEAGALYYWNSKTKLADQTVADTNTYAKQNCSDPNISADDDAVCKKFIADRQKFVIDTRAAGKYGLYGFVGLWIVGAAEAILDEPKAEAPKKEKKKRKYGGFSFDEGDPNDHPPRDLVAFDWDLGVIPRYDAGDDQVRPALDLKLNWKF